MDENKGRSLFEIPNGGRDESQADFEGGRRPKWWQKQLRWLPLLGIGLAILIPLLRGAVASPIPTVEYNIFKESISEGPVTSVEIGGDYLVTTGVDASGATFLLRTLRVDDPRLVGFLDENQVDYHAVRTRSNGFLSGLLGWLIPALIIVFFVSRAMRRQGGVGSDILSIGKNRSRIVAAGETGITFSDVAGADEAKFGLEEIVDFLKQPARYAEVGGRVPKGVLLVGAPGTGKTLLARAVAGEANVSFFRLSGAEFVEMFVGVGASRVRDLFSQARAKSPSIIFIDELDAIGKSRGASLGGNDEREQTLNQLLVELDGFDATTGVIVIAVTNRPKILDPALLRPGRFDRQVVVDKPDLKGREAILEIHSKKVRLDPNVDLRRVARGTAGLAGADLANIVNEAALLTVRAGRKKVAQEDFSEAIEKALTGLSRKNRILADPERRIVAFHEVGHALMAHHTVGADPVEKISIIPRGFGALGYTLQLPSEERFIMTKSELLGRIDVLLAGRAAEELVFGEVSTGAANDLTRAADIARRMITDYGMSDRFKNVYLPSQRSSGFLGDGALLQREYAESTQTYIDEETARMIEERYNGVLDLLRTKSIAIHELSEALLAEEVLDRERFEELVLGLTA